MYAVTSSGYPWHRFSIGVFTLHSLIFLYFSSLFRAFRPYHGSSPLRRYKSTYPAPSKSSLLLYSIPKCVLAEAYLAVPVKLFLSLYGICSLVWGFFHLLAKPKSIKYKVYAFSSRPISMFSGFKSLWMRFLLCK